MKSYFVFFVFLLTLSGLSAQSLKLQAIPYGLQLQNDAKSVAVADGKTLMIESPGGCDLFISPDGGYRADKAPRYLFRPDSDFILTARITPSFRKNWDAGVLVIYNDATHYAKFCFESDFTGRPRIVSVVCNEVADDCNSQPVDEPFVWFRITGSSRGNCFAFYYSKDGRQWFPIRTFRLEKSDNLKIGFSAQSPMGEGCRVVFSDIDLQQRKVADFWKGN
jgi:regulation of enolase protein 1 (concanavalin A-like superfamily)